MNPVGKEVLKSFPTDPCRSFAYDGVAGHIILECHQYAVHRHVAEYYNIDERGQNKEQYPAPALEVCLPLLPLSAPRLFRLFPGGLPASHHLVSLFNQLFVDRFPCGSRRDILNVRHLSLRKIIQKIFYIICCFLSIILQLRRTVNNCANFSANAQSCPPQFFSFETISWSCACGAYRY